MLSLIRGTVQILTAVKWLSLKKKNIYSFLYFMKKVYVYVIIIFFVLIK